MNPKIKKYIWRSVFLFGVVLWLYILLRFGIAELNPFSLYDDGLGNKGIPFGSPVIVLWAIFQILGFMIEYGLPLMGLYFGWFYNYEEDKVY